MQLPLIDDYARLFLDDTPLLDVRAPVEFGEGAFPQARNLPLINDAERHAIGIQYAELGQEQAIALGHELVQGDIREQRIQHWVEFTRKHPQGALYCFRGGMRSRISQQWIYETTGVAYPRIAGGYKALRRFLLQELEGVTEQVQALIVGGRTGVGKTRLLQQLEQQIDLEGIFRHRGSSFGYRALPQPSQIDIENRLAIALLKHRDRGNRKLVLEDEAPNIGSRGIPAGLVQLIRSEPLLLIEASLDERIDAVFAEYITASLSEFQDLYGKEQGFETWAEQLRAALDRIRRRLGDQRHGLLRTIMDDAISQQRHDANSEHHRQWIRSLLLDYYDPMYDFQLEKKLERVSFRGELDEVLEYLKSHHAIR